MCSLSDYCPNLCKTGLEGCGERERVLKDKMVKPSSLVLTGFLGANGRRPLPLSFFLVFVESALEQIGHFLTGSPEQFSVKEGEL